MYKKINVFDFNNLAIRVFFLRMIGAQSSQPDYQLWKFLVFSNIVKSLDRNQGTNEVLIAVDNRNSWRRQYWKGYKASRKPTRDKSGVNWDALHLQMAKLCTEMTNHLPFKVIQIQSAEADDIIGTVCLTYPKNEYVIISTDEDYIQLASPTTKIYNPLKKDFMGVHDPERFLIEKCLLGQKKDDIPNIKTPLDWPKDKKRPPFGEMAMNRVMAEGYEKWLKKNNLEKRFRENKILIDFKMIPKVIQERVLDAYNKYEYPSPDKIYEFVDKNQFQYYIDHFNSLETKLMKLY